MAERRMFAKTIIDSDAFLDMPMSARLLYYDLAMRADDDGFVNSPKKIMKIVGATSDDLNILSVRKFILPFESGVVVIKHWRIHNYIRKDTYSSTPYREELAMLSLDENKAYTLDDTSRRLSVDEPSTQDSIGKVSIDKVSIDKNRLGDSKGGAKEPKKNYGEHNNVLLTDEELEKLKNLFPDWEERIETLSSYMASKRKRYSDHYATIRNWARREEQAKKDKPKGLVSPLTYYRQQAREGGSNGEVFEGTYTESNGEDELPFS